MPRLRAQSRIAWLCSRSIAVRALGGRSRAPPLAVPVPALLFLALASARPTGGGHEVGEHVAQPA